MPTSKTKNIYFIIYPGSSLLDFSGPSGVFAVVNELLEEEVYQISCLSSKGGLVLQNNHVYIASQPISQVSLTASDTVLVVGAPSNALAMAIEDVTIKAFLNEASQQCQRFGSVCTGAFILGAAGLIDDKNVSTHWSSQKQLKASFQRANLDKDALYCVDGNLWTSAGVTTGIDMALAMVEADYNRQVKSQVAKHLLVYAHRSGHQSQFSDILLAQTHTDDKFSKLIIWLNENLDKAIKVDDMANIMAMSPRSFHRHFSSVFGQSPANFFLQMRLNHAQQLLEAGVPVSQVFVKVGFKSVSAFRSAFKEFTGLTPGFCGAMKKSV